MWRDDGSWLNQIVRPSIIGSCERVTRNVAPATWGKKKGWWIVVIGTWLKQQWRGLPVSEVHYDGGKTEMTRQAYKSLISHSDIVFAQWGAKTAEGNIVLGEYRP